MLIHGGKSCDAKGNEEYRGSWENDVMHGYGVYKYTSGAVYSGDWSNGMHHGRGTYEWPGGYYYTGEWKNHQMHGEGTFTDNNDKTWEDKFFVKGVFQSKMQKKLKMEKMEKVKKKQILENAKLFFENFQNTFRLCKTDKKKKKDYRKNLA